MMCVFATAVCDLDPQKSLLSLASLLPVTALSIEVEIAKFAEGSHFPQISTTKSFSIQNSNHRLSATESRIANWPVFASAPLASAVREVGWQ
jgi:hypothetical protein